MAMRRASTASRLGTADRIAVAVRTLSDVATAVGQGVRARNEYCALVGQGTDPVDAATTAIRNADLC